MALVLAGVADWEMDFGYIARPISDDPIQGPLEISSLNPRLKITGEKPSPAQDEWVDKVGQVTGWTYGKTTKLCLDIAREHGGADDPNPTKIAWRCQNHADYGSQPGDSGGPVFVWNGDNTVTLMGIHIGRNKYGGAWSSIDMIRLDLGLPTSDRNELKFTF